MRKKVKFIDSPAKGVIFVAIILMLALLTNSIIEIVKLKPFRAIENIVYAYQEGEGIFYPLLEILVTYFFCYALIVCFAGIILRTLKAKAKDLAIFENFITIKIATIFTALALISLSMLLISFPPEALIEFILILINWVFGFITMISLIVIIGGVIPLFLYLIITKQAFNNRF